MFLVGHVPSWFDRVHSWVLIWQTGIAWQCEVRDMYVAHMRHICTHVVMLGDVHTALPHMENARCVLPMHTHMYTHTRCAECACARTCVCALVALVRTPTRLSPALDW